ncbi:ABC transporter ATP-binding protein [Clostridium luticellarii]|jgi:peptide/nickel transport system ATP-binding protein/oligopeptide transport system ATP-binding protein|uniref:Oligopeptide transport ATP-binding protein OppF n=1 Tax=Clostridium luticellarii TaxID=1691940 RepID=A0A2T0BNL0_9CLOT|nr:ABC transporter ATP-binding protein [Clostridium luticellarii]MCI1944380.1 ABC transporter ATP-binding protein [Clostridium luticellarii]MCI1967500.1 ABC transporter ATP-binding protein [Clostridium luticellarii]MCI1995012.1 ABC transporter ATP-binding protein [Clostridium luticellarii]MCI2039549.1 ABC transporter ATP-binding protein [Clostridium luticellarii]PRR85461.1 Oligopeptide transport ATP-binding protein OppF [Clostridium luticellarii]
MIKDMEKQAAPAPLLSIKKLKTYYPIKRGILSKTVGYIKAVDGVDLEIYQGETLGLVGESGCGKSSMGRTIVRLENPTEGSIIFNNEDIAGYSNKRMTSIRTDLQIIFQDPYSSLNPKKRVYDILAEPLKVHKIVPEDKIPGQIDKLLDAVELPKNFKNRYPNQFSGGQRQRVGIARALALNPKLIVCDEPVSALDVSTQAQVLNLLKDLQKKLNLTYLFIAHGLGAVKYISDRIAVMYLGKIVEIASKDEIFKNPRHPYTKALLSAYPVPNPHMRNKERVILEGDVPSPANPPQGCRFHTRCKFARENVCDKDTPELKQVKGAEGEHLSACFFQDSF